MNFSTTDDLYRGHRIEIMFALYIKIQLLDLC